MTKSDETTPKRIQGLIGDGLLNALRGAQRAESYRLRLRPGPNDEHRIAGYRVDCRLDDLAPDSLATLRHLVLQDSTYDLEFTSRVPFMPQVALQLVSEAGEVVVIVDLDRNKLCLVMGDQRVQKDLQPDSGGAMALSKIVTSLAVRGEDA